MLVRGLFRRGLGYNPYATEDVVDHSGPIRLAGSRAAGGGSGGEQNNSG